jgi:DNA-binding CsgD family transcriptional regulator
MVVNGVTGSVATSPSQTPSGGCAGLSVMTDRELRDDVRRLRSAGATPKTIARTLGLAPGVVAPLVRRVAAETPRTPLEEGELAGCWISPGWSRELIVARREGWDDGSLASGRA